MDHRPADSAEANEGEPGSEGEPPVRFRDLLKILRPHHRTIAVAMVLSLFSAGLGVLQPLLAMRAIERAGAPDLYHILLLLGAVFVADAVIQTLSQYLLERVGEGLVLGLRKRLIANLLRLKIFVFERNRIGDLLARVGTDPTLLRQGVAYGFVDVWAGFFTLVASVALMVWIDWALFILTAATVAAAGALVTFALLGIREATERAQDRVGAMTADLERALGAIRTVRSAQGEERETERIVGHAQAAYRQGLRIARMESLVNPSIELAANGAFILVLVVGGIRVANESISLAELVAFLLYVSYLVVPVAVLFGSFAAVQKGMGALQRIQDAMDFSIEGEEKSDPSLASRSFEVVTQAQCAEQRPSTNDCTGNVALELENISFTYEDRDDPALRGVSFKVPRRAHWALVGPSGAGKSTLFALIERFYDPDEGVIRLAGRDLSHMSRAECRAQVALVEQHAPVLHGTLHDNLVYARPEASSAEIERVIELAGLREVVTRLPNGLNADVGERGESLSGGERQRLAIGRALLARPMLLLMDEPTAQLDTINEAALAASMEQIAADCTVLVIAHRLSTVRSADSIVVLDQGRVVGIGKHDQLVEGCLTYRTLADSKMLGGAARLAH